LSQTVLERAQFCFDYWGGVLLLLLFLLGSHFVFASQHRILFIVATSIYPRLVKSFLSPIFVVVEFRIFYGVVWISRLNGRFSGWIGCPFTQLTQIVFLGEYKRSYLFYADGGMQIEY